jgi:hypothetical protein
MDEFIVEKLCAICWDRVLVGWLLSRLPARKQKIYYSLDWEQGKVRSKKKKRRNFGRWCGILPNP